MRKKLLILYSHWPPSNLAGVHRPRLIGNYLDKFNWDVEVLTIHEDSYEEELDWDLTKLVSPKIVVYKVKARKVRKKRLIGDVVLRAYSNLKSRAIELIRETEPDFLWVPVPSFYMAVIARQVHDETGIPYGIDYIDPWVDGFTDADKTFSKGWMSNQLAKVLEPYSVKKASLISGVAKGYYEPVLQRNFKNRPVVDVAMPYGFDPHDHEVRLDNLEYPWDKDEVPVLYAGAFLPKSRLFVSMMFRALVKLKEESELDAKVRFYFIGTGYYSGKRISEYANENNIGDQVVEVRDRFPFLHILNFLSAASGVMVIGSTEAHYTASKTFQSILSGRPILACLHKESTAIQILHEASADSFTLSYDPEETNQQLFDRFYVAVKSYLKYLKDPQLPWAPDTTQLKEYSSEKSAEKLVDAMETCLVRLKNAKEK